MLHEKLTGEVIGAAMAVLNELKPGLDEKFYERALVIELKHLGHSPDQQREFPVFYKNNLIGKMIPDLLVDSLVVVDAKVATAINEDHIAQMLGYLAITGMQVGLIINFKYAKLQWKRIIRTLD